MSEELNKENQEQVQEYSDVEKRALEMGWRPREEFDGDDVDFVDAKEYIGRAPLYEAISQAKREAKQVRNALEALKTHYTAVRETEFQRALKTLKDERKAALSEGDGEKFEALDDEIKQVEKQAADMAALREQPLVQDTPVNPEFQRWANANPWYSTSKYMREFADEVGLELHASGMAPSDVLKEVSKRVRAEFPNKFVNPNRASAPNVADSSGKGASKGSPANSVEQSMSAAERAIMDTLVKSGVMTKEKYLADYEAIKAKSK